MSIQSNSPKKENQSWSNYDLACNNCRGRKIRCGRERPQCESCKRDGVQCRYTSPGKRVNHVKLLCQNFDHLEDKLSDIQCGISLLTSLVKGSRDDNQQGIGLGAACIDDKDTSAQHNNDLFLPSPDRHIVRDDSHLIERYHGPGSHFALCREFADTAASSLESRGSDAPDSLNSGALAAHLHNLCADAGREDQTISLNCKPEHKPVRPPPRQFLNMVLNQFFRQADHTKDIFEQTAFQSRVVDRIYNHPVSQPTDEAWAVCFNLMILLTLGTDQSTKSNDPFIQPFLQTLHAVGSNPRVFFSPRLVNVQALALMSVAAQQYSPPGFADLVFAQACALARTIGLHQAGAMSDSMDPVEARERCKVFRSLYIRDKQFAVSKGALPWLPGFDFGICSPVLPEQHHLQMQPCHDVSVEPGQAITARLELARLQDEIYRLFHSEHAASSQRRPSWEKTGKLAVLEQKLESWGQTHRVSKITRVTAAADGLELYLSFLATRIYLLRGSTEARCNRQVGKDSRTSCLLLLAACTKSSDPILLERFSERLSPSSPGLDTLRDGPLLRELQAAETGATFNRLATGFPISTFFTLAKCCVSARGATEGSGDDDEEEEYSSNSNSGSNSRSEEENDLAILEALRDLYQSRTDQIEGKVENYTFKLSRTLQTLVQAVYLLRQGQIPERSTAHHDQHQQRNDMPSILPPSAFDLLPSVNPAQSPRARSATGSSGRRVPSRTSSTRGSNASTTGTGTGKATLETPLTSNHPTPGMDGQSSSMRASFLQQGRWGSFSGNQMWHSGDNVGTPSQKQAAEMMMEPLELPVRREKRPRTMPDDEDESGGDKADMIGPGSARVGGVGGGWVEMEGVEDSTMLIDLFGAGYDVGKFVGDGKRS